MDLKLFASTFALIFLAELGDKTQLAALAASAGTRSPWSVFAGAASALVVATLIATLVGSTLQRFLPAHCIRGGAAVLFLLFGILLLISAVRARDVSLKPEPGLAKPALLTGLVLNIARDFEQASSAGYEQLAEHPQAAELQELFRHLAAEEKQHLQTIGRLGTEHAHAQWPGNGSEAVTAPGPTPSSSPSAQRVISDALVHERATERFYRGLADKARIPSLRAALSELAQAEASHVRHLQQFLVTGTFGEPSA